VFSLIYLCSTDGEGVGRNTSIYIESCIDGSAVISNHGWRGLAFSSHFEGLRPES
jgi:hypothetical protein